MKKKLFTLVTVVSMMLASTNVAAAQIYCENCGKQLRETANFCGSCGTAVENEMLQDVTTQDVLHCTGCGASNSADSVHCTVCGELLTGDIDEGEFLGAEIEHYTIGGRVLENCPSYREDVLKNYYDYNICSDDSLYEKDDCSVEYLLNGEYDILSGVLYHPMDTKGKLNEDGAAQHFMVYGDDKLLFEYKDAVTIDPVEIKVDVSGVRILKIVISGSYHTPGGFGFDPTLAAGNMKVSTR